MVCTLLPIAALADGPSGSINGAVITQNAVSVELENVKFESSVQVKLYRDETLLTTATLKPGILAAGQNHLFVTCCIPTKGEDDAWPLTTWTPKDDVVPNKAVLVVDGHELNTKTFTLDAAEWKALPGTVRPSSNVTNGTATENKPSPKTFDAGIAMYVGMALTSVAGSAVVIGKKKEF